MQKLLNKYYSGGNWEYKATKFEKLVLKYNPYKFN